MRGSVIIGLFVTSAALVGVLLHERIDTADDRVQIAAPAPNAAPNIARNGASGGAPGIAGSGDDAAAGKAAAGAAAVAVVLARPLFEPGRRPVTAATAAGAPPEKLPRLTGVLVTPAGRHVIFASPVHGKPVIATEGTHIGNFVVQSIASGEVTVLGPDGAHTIRPSFDTGVTTPALAGSVGSARANPMQMPIPQALPGLPPT
jgi:hypothetical protein